MVEVDTVMHCGDSASVIFANTVTMTDIRTDWAECIAVLRKEAESVKEDLKILEARIPFPI